MAQIQVQHQSPVALGNGVPASQLQTTSLYVGDLDCNVTESHLFDLFNQVCPVISVRVCRDVSTRRSLGYGYVNYSNPHDAEKAISALNFAPVNNRSIRVMYSQRDPSLRKSGAANLFIKNLDRSIDNKSLHDTFSSFGNIVSCKIATDSNSKSKGYGFVQFDNEESAQNAIYELNGKLINDKQVYVGHYLRKEERDASLNRTKFNNVFIKNLSDSITDEDIVKIFGEFGNITSAVVMRDDNGKSKGFGFVNFDNADDAAKAVEALNGKKVDDKELFVGKAQKKPEREQELKSKFQQSENVTVDKYQGLNLYVKNLDASIDDTKLKDMFSQFGVVTSSKVMLDPSGVSRGCGFVAFSTLDEASRALSEMNGKLVVSKPLYVALAQRKEERRANLQTQFSEMRPLAMAPSPAPRAPFYPPGAPGITRPLFYGQPPPALIGSQQIVRGMRPGGASMPNFWVPMGQQLGQQALRPGGRHGAVPVVQQNQQPFPLMQQQMLPRGRVHHFPVGGGMSLPRGNATRQLVPITALASALANAPPEQHKIMLGETLFPLVNEMENQHAGKVTGMLLEMDETEVLHLLESPEALKTKVAEAVEVLNNNTQQAKTPAELLASLSLAS